MLPLLSLNVLYISYIKIIIIQPMVVCKKELIRTKIIKKKKKKSKWYIRKRSDFDGSRREHVVCRFYLPHGSPQRAKHNAREGGNIGRGAAKGEEI